MTDKQVADALTGAILRRESEVYLYAIKGKHTYGLPWIAPSDDIACEMYVGIRASFPKDVEYTLVNLGVYSPLKGRVVARRIPKIVKVEKL